MIGLLLIFKPQVVVNCLNSSFPFLVVTLLKKSNLTNRLKTNITYFYKIKYTSSLPVVFPNCNMRPMWIHGKGEGLGWEA